MLTSIHEEDNEALFLGSNVPSAKLITRTSECRAIKALGDCLWMALVANGHNNYECVKLAHPPPRAPHTPHFVHVPHTFICMACVWRNGAWKETPSLYVVYPHSVQCLYGRAIKLKVGMRELPKQGGRKKLSLSALTPSQCVKYLSGEPPPCSENPTDDICEEEALRNTWTLNSWAHSHFRFLFVPKKKT